MINHLIGIVWAKHEVIYLLLCLHEVDSNNYIYFNCGY